MSPSSHLVLIAGCGYVGSQVAKGLAENGHECLALTLSGKASPSIPCQVMACDLNNSEAVSSLSHGIPAPSAIVHCASSKGGGPDEYRAVYQNGVQNLTSSFPDSHILFTSSTSVYAQSDGSAVNEDSPTEPARETAQILRAAEDIVLNHGGTVLRLSGIYGPGRCIYLQRLLDGTAVIESGEPSRYLNQIHRDDAAAAIIHLLQKPASEISGEIYNVSDGRSPTQRECYEELASYLNYPLPPEGPASSLTKSTQRARTHRRISNQKLIDSGWRPVYLSLLDALKKDPELLASFR